MTAFPRVEDVGLTGGTPRYDPDELSNRLSLQAPLARTVLLTFGGLGLQAIPYHQLAQWSDWQFLTFDYSAPTLPNLLKVPRSGVRPVDVMPLCSRIVSKPGFSTFSEACRLDLPIITITRSDFAEGALLVNGVQDHSWHRILTPNEFFQDKWEFLLQPLYPPRTTEAIAKHGNEDIANAIVDYLTAL